LEAAKSAGAVVRIDRDPGSSLVEGVPFATAWPVAPGATLSAEAREKLARDINAAVATGFERTNVQDVGFGFRQLVDVAARALSPGINDPTTAVHVIGHLSALLCGLAERDPGPEQLVDDDGRARVVLSLPALREFLSLAMDQPRHYGAADPAVAARLLQLLKELAWCDREGRYRAEIADHLGRMRNAIGSARYSTPERKSLMDLADSIHGGYG
jgi:uncharacterized membrane protein